LCAPPQTISRHNEVLHCDDFARRKVIVSISHRKPRAPRDEARIQSRIEGDSDCSLIDFGVNANALYFSDFASRASDSHSYIAESRTRAFARNRQPEGLPSARLHNDGKVAQARGEGRLAHAQDNRDGNAETRDDHDAHRIGIIVAGRPLDACLAGDVRHCNCREMRAVFPGRQIGRQARHDADGLGIVACQRHATGRPTQQRTRRFYACSGCRIGNRSKFDQLTFRGHHHVSQRDVILALRGSPVEQAHAGHALSRIYHHALGKDVYVPHTTHRPCWWFGCRCFFAGLRLCLLANQCQWKEQRPAANDARGGVRRSQAPKPKSH
jgi:hypothetical protein